LDLYINDWVVFTIKRNDAHVKPLEMRKTPLKPGERLYAVGWTNAQLDGPQRTYEYAYYKTIGRRILLKELIVPAKAGGLSGAPVIDENGLLVGFVSSGAVDPETGKKFFSACTVIDLADFLDKYQSKK
jgi:Trypsin